jgi:hypothetical protein
MDKKFRNLILSQVEAVVHDKPAGRQSLYDLLRIATPDLKLHMVDNTSQREHAYRALKVLIHPDKYRKALRNDDKEMARVTKIFQERITMPVVLDWPWSLPRCKTIIHLMATRRRAIELARHRLA